MRLRLGPRAGRSSRCWSVGRRWGTARRSAGWSSSFKRTVHAICLRRLGNPSEAAELTQEVFLHVMRRIDQLREPERFAGWLRQVTVRMAINRATRRIAPSCVETVVLEGACAERDDPLAELIARERAQRLWQALGAAQGARPRGPCSRSTSRASRSSRSPIGSTCRSVPSSGACTRPESGSGPRLVASAGDADEWSDAARPNGLEDDDSGSDELVGVGPGTSAAW